MHKNLAGKVKAGEIIKPWLLLGPFNEDVSDSVQGLTLFEKAGATVGRATMAEVMAQAEAILSARPREGDETPWRGQPARWELVRRPRSTSRGAPTTSPTTWALPSSPSIVTPKRGLRRWRLTTGITSRAVVAINGKFVFDSDAHPSAQVDSVFEYTFEAELPAGESAVTVALFRLGRMAQVGCRLECVDSELDGACGAGRRR